MKPESTSPNLTPEQLPPNTLPGVEKLPVLDTPETGFGKGAEAYEQTSEANAARSDIGLTTVLPVPVLDDQTTTVSTTIPSGNPATANDDDLIEKEWVDKAKKIVADTHDDPYKRDDEVNKLQVDYLKKRFGRELGTAE
ncbi:MAG TPA: hypothetical protein VMR16_03095 [Candidatus Saccharimonadales bacterium]|nr:hypothetical protein [Candidatus Saccharimonadales bacterium]